MGGGAPSSALVDADSIIIALLGTPNGAADSSGAAGSAPQSDPGGAVEGLARLIVGWVLARPVEELVAPDWVADAVLTAACSPGLEALLRAHLPAVAATELARLSQTGELAGAWVPDHVAAGVGERLGRPFPMPDGWDADIVDPSFARAVLADALADVLERTLAQLPLGGRAGGLLGSLTRTAGRMSGGRNPVSRRARELAGAQAGLLRERTVAQLYAPENAREMAATAQRALRALLKVPLADLVRQADDPGWDVIAGWTAQVVASAAARPEVQAAVRGQLADALERTGAVSLGEWLEQLGYGQAFRAQLGRRLAGPVRAFVSTAEFKGWLEELLLCTEP